IDFQRTQAYGGAEAQPEAVMTNDQDVTPGDEARAIFDLQGNAQEWTADLYRLDGAGDESWVQGQGFAYRTVRGLPLKEKRPASIPVEGAAAREALCTGAKCPPDAAKGLEEVGFRCVRIARSAP